MKLSQAKRQNYIVFNISDSHMNNVANDILS